MVQATASRLETFDRTSDRGGRGPYLPAAVAHELANPLAAITQAVSLLRASLRDADDLDLADCVLAEGRRLRRLVQRAAVAGWRPIRAIDANSIETVVHGVLALVRLDPRVPAGVAFHVRTAPELAPVVMDADAIAQVLWNLLLNAVQAVDAGGNVTVLAEWAGEARLGVEVRDDGRGLPEGHAERLVGPHVSHRRGGSGLGLAVSREIVEAHGGELQLGPSQGGGTRVRFWIPRNGPRT